MNKMTKEYPQLIVCVDFEYWLAQNESELNCIFAETGADRELDFDRENAEIELFLKQFESAD